MQIIGARQQFNVSQQQLQFQARIDVPSLPPKQQSSNSPPAATLTQPPLQRQTAATQSMPTTPSTAKAESTIEDKEKEEDSKEFSALHTIGQVKKILEQLVSGKLFEWIDSNTELPPSLPATDGAATSEPSTTAPVNAGPRDHILVNYRYQQLSASFSGELSLSDGSSVSWDFKFEHVESEFSFDMRRAADVKDPLVLSLDGSFRATQTMLNFALNTDGSGQIDGLSGAQFYLVHDKNGNGKADDGSELFGPQSGQGFSELAKLDEDDNGFIDSADGQFNQLFAWQPGKELQTLKQINVAALSISSAETNFDFYQQNQLQARLQRSGVLITDDKRVGLIQQVDFAV